MVSGNSGMVFSHFPLGCLDVGNSSCDLSLDLLERGEAFPQLLTALRGGLLHKLVIVVGMVVDDAISTNEAIACEAEQLEHFIMLFAFHWRGLLGR